MCNHAETSLGNAMFNRAHKIFIQLSQFGKQIFAITTLSVNNMKTRLIKPQVLELKMIPKIYSLLLTTFRSRWVS